MKLTTNNILCVYEYVKGETAYQYHVITKSHLVSDARSFVNYDENGRTTVAEYHINKLPKAVQKFIYNATCHLERCEDDFAVFAHR